jgi:hypothetical protein
MCQELMVVSVSIPLPEHAALIDWLQGLHAAAAADAASCGKAVTLPALQEGLQI